MKNHLERYYSLYLVALLVTAVIFFHLNWIQEDTRNQPFIDPYPQRILEFADGISEQGIRQLPQLIYDLRIGPRPPLYQIIAGGFVSLFGRSIDAMLGANLFLNGVLILATFAAGTVAKNRHAGLLAALFVATYPPLANLTRLARPHAIAPAAVALWLWFMLLLLRKRSWQVAWLFSLSLAFGFLIHPNLIYLLGLPSLLFIIYYVFFHELPQKTDINSLDRPVRHFPSWIRGKLATPFVYKGLAPSLLVALILTAVWYIPQITGVTYLVELSASQWSAARYGFSHIPASFWWYALTLPGAISYLLSGLFFISLAVYLFARQRFPFALAVTFLLMYLGFGLRQGTLAWMNFAPILPVVAILTAVFLIDFVNYTGNKQFVQTAVQPQTWQMDRLFAVFLLLVSIVAAGFNFYAVTGKLSANSKLAAQLLGAPLDSACGWRMNVAFCPNPPRQQAWPLQDILQIPLDDPLCQEKVCTLAVATESAESFSNTTLSYALSRDFPGANIDIVPIRLQSRQYSLDWLKSDYLVYIPQIQNNPYANAVAQFLVQPPASFAEHYAEVGQIALPQGWTAVILKHTQPLTDEEISAFANMLNVSDDVKANLRVDFSFREDGE